MPLRKHKDGFLLDVKALPRSSRSEIVGVRADRVAVKLTAPPVDGKANKELVRLLAKKLGLPKSDVVIVAGESSSEKTILIRTARPEGIMVALGLSENEE